MAKTAADLITYLGSGASKQSDFVADCFEQAVVLVDRFVGGSEVPEEILDLAYLTVGADLFNRKSAPNGIMNAQYASDGDIANSPMRIARDPMAGVYSMLGKWVSPW